MTKTCIVALSLSLTLALPQAREVNLPVANAVAAAEFHTIISVRELPDGQAVIADQGEHRVVVVDFERGSVQSISRRGSGPGEFERVSALFPMRGDTTVMPDVSRARWLILAGREVVRTLINVPVTDRLAQHVRIVLGSDSTALLARGKEPPDRTSTYDVGPLDSIRLLRFNMTSGRIDTLGGLRRAPFRMIVSPGLAPGEYFRRSVPVAWAGLGETASQCADGWIAVVRMDPYRVDWLSPDRRWIRGRPIPYERVRATPRERDFYRSLNRSRFETMMDTTVIWPDEVAPQGTRQPICAPDGRVFVSRTLTADSPNPKFDVVDRGGVLVARLALGSTQRLIGFGPRSMYVVTRDSLDVERLSRHPYAPFAERTTRPE
jgi:hypothetical protein